MGRIEQIKERLDSELYVFTEHNNTYGHVNEFREAHEDIEYLLSRLQITEEALQAYNYYKPLDPPRGGGQAEGKMSCGHIGRVGAPLCYDCAKQKIREALEQIRGE